MTVILSLQRHTLLRNPDKFHLSAPDGEVHNTFDMAEFTHFTPAASLVGSYL